MTPQPIEGIYVRLLFLAVGFFVAFFFFVVFFLLFLRKREGRRGDTCPYDGGPMSFGMDIARSLAATVNAFLQEQSQPENPCIDFTHASYCPRSGRIFPNTVIRGDRIRLSRDFLQKRWPGMYVSWGSLSEDERGVLRLLHDSLEDFQTAASSSNPLPERVEQEYIQASPGPCYVDRQKKHIIGWKKVPGTYFEVLVVQRPRFQSLEETL